MLVIIYDATPFENYKNRNGTRAGIYVCANEILKELSKNTDIKLYLYSKIEIENTVREMVQNNYPSIKIINEKSSLFRFIYFKLLSTRNNISKSNSFFLILFRKLLSLICKISLHFSILPIYNKDFKKITSCAKIYFSPQVAVPRCIKNKKNITKITILHDAIEKILSQNENYKSINKKDWFEKMFNSINPNDYYFANSITTKNDFLKINNKISPSHTFVVYHAASSKYKSDIISYNTENIYKRYSIPQSSNGYIFSLCSLIPRKNLIRSIRCFLLFIQKHNISDLFFVIGGGSLDENFAGELKKQFSNNTSYDTSKIIITGYVDDEDLPFFYKNARWFVYTSRYEGFGVPPLEAMSCGCPVIVSNTSSLPEVVGNSGIQVTWDSDEEHIKAYEDFFYNEEKRKKCIQKGLSRSTLFSWKKSVNQMVSIMNNIVT